MGTAGGWQRLEVHRVLYSCICPGRGGGVEDWALIKSYRQILEQFISEDPKTLHLEQ